MVEMMGNQALLLGTFLISKTYPTVGPVIADNTGQPTAYIFNRSVTTNRNYWLVRIEALFGLIYLWWFQQKRELKIATRKTNSIHSNVKQNATFLLHDHPWEEANRTGTLISKVDELAINAKIADWRDSRGCNPPSYQNRWTIYHLILLIIKIEIMHHGEI